MVLRKNPYYIYGLLESITYLKYTFIWKLKMEISIYMHICIYVQTNSEVVFQQVNQYSANEWLTQGTKHQTDNHLKEVKNANHIQRESVATTSIPYFNSISSNQTNFYTMLTWSPYMWHVQQFVGK